MTRKREFAAVTGYMNFISIHSFFSDFNEDGPVLFMIGYICWVQRNFFRKDGFDVIRKAFTPASPGVNMQKIHQKKREATSRSAAVDL